MSSTEKTPLVDSGWRQLEQFVDELHLLARSQPSRGDFYQKLLQSSVTMLAADGGAVWVESSPGRWQLLAQVNLDPKLAAEESESTQAHHCLLRSVSSSDEPVLLGPQSGQGTELANPSDSVLLLAAVRDSSQNSTRRPHAVVEFRLRSGSSPEVQHGWREMASTVCQIAGDYHLYEQLHSLQLDRRSHDQALALLRRVHGSTNLKRTAFEIANEGRRFLQADRVSVLIRRGRRWLLQAVSGVDRVSRRSDTAKRLVRLARSTARWGEPIDYGDEQFEEGEDGYPPQISNLVEQHADQDDIRRLVAVPVEFAKPERSSPLRRKKSNRPSAVLIAEQFSATGEEFSRERMLELAQLCEPAMRQASRFSRFPLSAVVWTADRLSRLSVWRAFGMLLLSACLTAAVLALVYVPYDFEVEASATLEPLAVRDVFASASGTIVQVNFSHGDQVEEGDVLAVLHDPQLLLDVERVQGEIETVRRRREAIAIVRTERQVRQQQNEGLPLSAESQQLEERLSSLERQLDLLDDRREALTLRSPIAGRLLTLDVQNLLRSRPVQRGQLLFSVADPSAGWWLRAEVDQDRLGHLLAARDSEQEQLPVRFRLAGDVEQTYSGHLEEVSSVAVLKTDDLHADVPSIEVRVAVEEPELEAARPGMSADVRIYCGQRPLGYVWLHDLWETIYGWWIL